MLCVLDKDTHSHADVGCCWGAGRGGDGLCGGGGNARGVRCEGGAEGGAEGGREGRGGCEMERHLTCACALVLPSSPPSLLMACTWTWTCVCLCVLCCGGRVG